MPRKYVTKKLVKRLNELTSLLFKQSIIEVMNIEDATDEQLQDFISKVRRAGFRMAAWSEEDGDLEDIANKKEKIDELYLTKIISLSSKDLNDILFLHDYSKPRRAQRTVEAITSELARRLLLDDSSQSDAIDKQGDVDVRSKSKSTGKKASSKKRKTNKDR